MVITSVVCILRLKCTLFSPAAIVDPGVLSTRACRSVWFITRRICWIGAVQCVRHIQQVGRMPGAMQDRQRAAGVKVDGLRLAKRGSQCASAGIERVSAGVGGAVHCIARIQRR